MVFCFPPGTFRAFFSFWLQPVMSTQDPVEPGPPHPIKLIMKPHQIVILGSGPAGLTAALYAARAGLDPVLYGGSQPGGQLTLTSEVDNFPGYPKGVMGPEMIIDFQEQARRFGTDIRSGSLTSSDFSSNPIALTIDGSEQIHTRALVLATGASARWLGLESEEKLQGKGVSSCAVCDGFFYKGMDVVVVGGGDSAAEESSYLSKICSHVHLLVRKNQMRASTIMQQRLKSLSNLTIHYNYEVKHVLGDQEVAGVEAYNNQTKETTKIDAAGFFVAIGHIPNTQPFVGKLDMDPQGYILTRPGSTITSVEGVFAAGDVQDKTYRQAITAAASGCMGALDAERFLALQGAG